MKRLLATLLLAPVLVSGLYAQYNLEEIGVEFGPGLSILPAAGSSALGPGGNANFFYSHYACGKGYGFHLAAGATALFPSVTHGNELLDMTSTERTGIQLAGVDVAVLGKLRIHEYHRPREWAVFCGPKLMVPLLLRYGGPDGSGPLSDVADKVNRLLPGVELSVQFRRPFGKKQSWFIHPGADYYFLPVFSSNVAGGANALYIFLNFGVQLWDQRG